MSQSSQQIVVAQTGGFAGIRYKEMIHPDDPRISQQWVALKVSTNFDTIKVGELRDVEPGFSGRYDGFIYSIESEGRRIKAEGGDSTPLAAIISKFVKLVLSLTK